MLQQFDTSAGHQGMAARGPKVTREQRVDLTNDFIQNKKIAWTKFL